MKYIRTKEGELHFNLGETENGVLIEYNYLGDGLDLVVNCDAIEKQANTIEELCDEFVVIDKTWEEPLHIVLDTKDDMESYLPSEIYGAIWTDKGLIYVAKMNDKGELELL